MKIHLFGASGSGVTTLGKALSIKLGIPYFDSDDFFWEKSEQPFTVKRNKNERNKMLADKLAQNNAWILGGSIVSWGEELPKLFDLVVFIWIPVIIRMDRLAKREYGRYGNVIYTDAGRNQLYAKFMEWAAAYDNPDNARRSLAVHEQWMKKLNCQVLEIRGDYTVAERVKSVLQIVEPMI